MAKRTGPTNVKTKKLIRALEKMSAKEKVGIWKDIAERLSKPSRSRAAVNVGKIQKHCHEGESAIVPGKLLGVGEITRPIVVGALSCSRQAREKIEGAKGSVMDIDDFAEKNPKGKNVRIII